MKILVFLSLLFAQSALAVGTGSSLSLPSMNVGGRIFSDVTSNLIVLCGTAGNAAAQKWTSLRKQNGTAGYAVTAAKTYVVSAVQFLETDGVAGSATLGYADTDAGIVQAVPTNPVYINGNASTDPVFPMSSTIGTQYGFPLYWTVPAGKYPFVSNVAATLEFTACIYGYEQ